jgi:ADP-L-glycero-D-manno-heptose 6-epimerase
MIVLTGGAGFIGANTLAALNARGRGDVLVVDDIGSSGQWRHLVGRSYLGYLHRDELWRWLAGEGPAGSIPAPAAGDPGSLDAVIHLGACSDTTEEDFDYLTVNNIRYSRRLWRLCARRGVPFVYASSAATYGDGSLGFSDDHELVPELEPLNAYGYSKHRFDLWALERAEEAPPAWYGLKFFNVYVPHEDHKGRMASVAHHAIGQARRKGRIRLFRSHRPDVEDGEQKRDFVWVGDAVETILNVLDRRPPSGLYNVGTGRARTFADMARAIFEALDRPPSIEYFDMPEDLRGRYQYFTEADVGKLKKAEAAPSWTSLEEGIARYVEHALAASAGASGASGPAGASA